MKAEMEIKKAWLIRWGFYDSSENDCLKNIGIKNKIIDIISKRESFNNVFERGKEIYKMERLSLSKKVYFADYQNGAKRKESFFKGSTFTFHQGEPHQRLLGSCSNGSTEVEIEKARQCFQKSARYAIIGHNPHLMIEEVFDVKVQRDVTGREEIAWSRFTSSGKIKRETYRIKTID